MLARWETNFGHPLLIPARGLGTRLTPFAARLLELDAQIRESLAPQLAAAAEQMAQGLAEAAAPARGVPRIHASHDLALALLPPRMAKQGRPVDLQFHGSLESLASFAEGRCEIAGFHCPEGPPAPRSGSNTSPISSRASRCIDPAGQAQPGHPGRARQSEEAARHPRPDAAGRAFPQPPERRRHAAAARLAAAGERHRGTQTIAGYGDVEMTHSAVAAMIASGHADAGLGVEAAARQFDLGFVPLLKEDYFLVTRRELLRQPAHSSAARYCSRETPSAAPCAPCPATIRPAAARKRRSPGTDFYRAAS
jgi:putative molybdopterin biosynthesis protein